MQAPGDPRAMGGGRLARDGVGHRQLVGAPAERDALLGARTRREDGEDAAGQAAGPGTGEVEVAVGPARDEGLSVPAEQRVVVSVEDALHTGTLIAWG